MEVQKVEVSPPLRGSTKSPIADAVMIAAAPMKTITTPSSAAGLRLRSDTGPAAALPTVSPIRKLASIRAKAWTEFPPRT